MRVNYCFPQKKSRPDFLLFFKHSFCHSRYCAVNSNIFLFLILNYGTYRSWWCILFNLNMYLDMSKIVGGLLIFELAKCKAPFP